MRGTAAEKRLRGRYLTTGNPFHHPAFDSWWHTLPGQPSILEPFAGANGIPALVRGAGYQACWTSYDVEPLAPSVHQRDTLADFPTGHDVVVTNPPYLARHFARRKGLDVDHLPWGQYNNLYKVSLDRCLGAASHVAAIIPESFLTSGLFLARLTTVVSLTDRMFDDTEMPTCLALWGPSETADFDVWRGLTLMGAYSRLAQALPDYPAEATRIRFNVIDGKVGLRAVDNPAGPSIRFVPAVEIPAAKIKESARLVSRISVADLASGDVATVLDTANARLATYRANTQDVLLTAFKGVRADGAFRRRIDFSTARALLAAGLHDATARPVEGATP